MGTVFPVGENKFLEDFAGVEDWWEHTKRHNGLIMAGRPHNVDEGIESVGTVFPVGENKFLEDFAEPEKTKTHTQTDTELLGGLRLGSIKPQKSFLSSPLATT